MKRSVLVGAVAALVASPAFAGLIGGEIQARWQFERFDQTETFLVGPGPEGPWRETNLDIDDSSISIDYRGNAIGQAKGTVWTFSDLDWVETPGEIVGVSASTNWNGWSDDFVSFGADYVRVDFPNGVNFDSTSDFLLLDLDARHPGAVIPEPSAALLFAIGTIVAGSGIRRRRV